MVNRRSGGGTGNKWNWITLFPPYCFDSNFERWERSYASNNNKVREAKVSVDVDCVVIGAGVIGLAVARELAYADHEVVILEQEHCIGSGISSRNSEVIHAGLYYPPGSLKAVSCVDGKKRLYAYCEERHIAHRRCGKLIVATDQARLADLSAIDANARECGVSDLEWLSCDAARQIEPALECVAALFSPSTGIIDTHGFMLSLLGDAEDKGALIAYGSTVESIIPTLAGIEIRTTGFSEPQLRCRTLINAAGLNAGNIARSIVGFPASHVPKISYAKGNYFALTGKSPFSRLIYPLPEPGGLGIHFTLDLVGCARFGPDVEWLDSLNYEVDEARVDSFYPSIRKYWPGLKDDHLRPAYAGIRPKLSGPGEAAADFCISGPAEHGVPGVINLFGLESPGLTASLAIGGRLAKVIAPSGKTLAPDHQGL
tara:strand:+ start:1830 stop:3113 length:1284 start_codon:yes stop_codon:yes gene_type:complete